ncbi:hypothetical protein BCR33DRAFT_715935 [Rhizoclosmatium globosum]|uniref:CBM1 domain-containing protein n=1 Tax=Rhizoclosmatium globosum TaxID=329046 RepID=A0A1Y2CG43_9FUNG|nr:hypothetical protein BCR33DRAFT_715935 [Rhizoclosmatium globosum]|eukprot:ORY45906.1 hypothetical protein BCR33DRAFT_715935 [Rhizoclosmatium globosum]
MRIILAVSFAFLGLVSASSCPPTHQCTSTRPDQNPKVDWQSYCSQTQAGKDFCALGINDCACLPLTDARTSHRPTKTKSHAGKTKVSKSTKTKHTGTHSTKTHVPKSSHTAQTRNTILHEPRPSHQSTVSKNHVAGKKVKSHQTVSTVTKTTQ